jgi:hypothetical protein
MKTIPFTIASKDKTWRDPTWQLGYRIRIPELCDSRNQLET